MLIIEGLDGSGKTTLINELLNDNKQILIPENINNSFVKYQNILKKLSLDTLMDRSFISEMVYGKILSNKTKLTEDEYYQLLTMYAQNHSTIIYLYAPKDILLRRKANDKKDQFILLNFYDKLLNEFDYRLNQAHDLLPTYKINTCEHNQEQVLSKVKKLAKL